MVQAAAFARVDWQILPTRSPRLHRYCPGCHAPNAFDCTDNFRINANKRVVDVWLLYRCVCCDTSYKRNVLERRPVATLDPALLECFHHNDAATARRIAFDPSCVDLERDIPFRVERPALTDYALVRAVMPYAFRLRWDRLLAHELGRTRSQIASLGRAGRLVLSGSRNSLRKTVRDGDFVAVDLRERVF